MLTPDIKTERQFVRKYLKVCEEKGWIPKYHRFLDKSKRGKFIYTKGYYKLLLDFKLFDEKGTILPQKAVVPIFDNEVNKRILEEYVEGEKAKAPNDEVYAKVVDAMVEQGRLTEEQVVEAMDKRYSVMDTPVSAEELAEIEAERKSIIETAKANGTYLKAPNGKNTNLTAEQWVDVRTSRFKKWFGDWEKAARIEKLRSSNDAEISGNEIAVTDDYKQNKKNALKYSQSFTGQYTNTDTGVVIGIYRGRQNGGINEVLQHNYKDVAHIQSIAAIPQIIENSIYIESQPNNDVEKNPDVTEYQCYVCGLKIGDEEYTVLAKIAVDKNGNRYYDHNLTSIAKGKLIDIANNEQSAVTSGFGTTPDTESTTNSQRKYKELISILQTNSSKIVDENGEPKVVYHQTNHSVYINRETGQNWDELDWRERMEWDERDDWDEYWDEQEFNTFSRVNARTTNEFDGFFFAPEYDEYHEYGDRTIEAFLNIENPASNGDYYIDSSKNNAGRAERIRLQNEGYDGVIREYDGVVDEYIAFSPNQIKSAEPVTYDDNGNVIPLSERFNPEKEDLRYSINDFDSKVGYITYEANALGVEQTIIVAETLNEYLEALKDLGVKDIERCKKSAGIYDEDADVIVMRSDIIQYEQQAFETLIHEYAHAHTNNLRGEIENVLQRLDEGLIFAYRDEKLHEIYRKISANGILGA